MIDESKAWLDLKRVLIGGKVKLVGGKEAQQNDDLERACLYHLKSAIQKSQVSNQSV